MTCGGGGGGGQRILLHILIIQIHAIFEIVPRVMLNHYIIYLNFLFFLKLSPKCVQNSPSIASGLAVGASVIPVIIKASLFFSMDWSIGRG